MLVWVTVGRHLGMRFKLGVDKQHTFFTNKYADVRESIGSLNHMHASRDWYGAEFYVVETVANLGYCDRWGQGREKEN